MYLVTMAYIYVYIISFTQLSCFFL